MFAHGSLLSLSLHHSVSATNAGLFARLPEILSLPEGAVEERFDLEKNEGLAHLFLGHCTQGVEGGAFLYTNRSSLSIGVVAKLHSLQKKEISIADLLEAFKNSPSMAKKILEHRNANGPFSKIDDLMKVKGIGQGKFEKIKEQIII